MRFVYILECSDNTYYTGITTDLERRIFEHNNSIKAAKYTKTRRPVKLIYKSSFESRSKASKEEYRIKNLTRKDKEKIINKF